MLARCRLSSRTKRAEEIIALPSSELDEWEQGMYSALSLSLSFSLSYSLCVTVVQETDEH
jgi:hypothetical protein